METIYIATANQVVPREVLLEYIGGQPGTRTFRGDVTGREYRFGDNEGHRIQLVEVGDVPYFLTLHGQFAQVGTPSRPPPEIEHEILQREIEATAIIDSLQDDIHFLKEDEATLQDRYTELLAKHQRLLNAHRQRLFDDAIGDSEIWPPDDWTDFEDFDMFGRN